MDELSPLFHDIEFNERFRGYDVEEVDAYVDRVAKAAALVQGRIAELQERVAAAEARPARVVAADPTPMADDGSLARVLVLAQRTADAAIEEAKAEAESLRQSARTDADLMRREADDHASLVLAEAETDRRRIVAEAEAQASAVATAERDRIADEIAELERYRAFLNDDIAILETHLADARLAVAASVSALSDLIERPETFRTASMPATSGVEAPAPLASPTEIDLEPAATEPPTTAAIGDDADVAAPGPSEPEARADAAMEADPLVFAPAEEPVDLNIEPEPTQPIEVIPVEPLAVVEGDAEPEAAMDVAEAESADLAVDHIESVDAAEPEPEPVAGIDTDATVGDDAPFDVERLEDEQEQAADPAPAVAEGAVAPNDVDDGLEASDPTPAEAPDVVAAEAAEVASGSEPAAVDLALDFDLDLTTDAATAEVADAGHEEIVDLTDTVAEDDVRRAAGALSTPAAPADRPDDTGSTATLDRPRLVTSEDLETETGEPTMAHPAVGHQAVDSPSPAAPETVDEFLFADPEPTANDHFLDQLRDAVNSDDTPDEFGEDALAAFFDDGDDDDSRGWFNRRR